MNKIKYLIITFSILIFNLIYAEEAYELTQPKEYHRNPSFSYNYVNFGVGPIIIAPNIGLGHRQLKGTWGWDASLNIGVLGYINDLQVIGNLLYIPKPFEKRPMYFGIGVAGGYVFGSYFKAPFTIAPDFLIGKELSNNGKRKTFVEMHIQAPTWGSDTSHDFKIKNHLKLPLVLVKYGIGF